MAIHKLKEIHTATHPAKLKEVTESHQSTQKMPATKDELLSALAAEAEEENETSA
ncbi:hypothetical protein [Thiolapillus sp.]|uniref:hypothetical protein n=1 Tax=Thiolapillus sp. TaxID=2017437 RepID=UPI003AF5EB14